VLPRAATGRADVAESRGMPLPGAAARWERGRAEERSG
jgi:hypothetical protein